MTKRNLFLGLTIFIAMFGAQFTTSANNNGKDVKFTVRIENISGADGQTAADGSKWPFALSPGMWVLHDKEVRLFKEGNPAINGLEAQAEDGNPAEIIKALEGHHSGMLHGVFNTPVGANGPGPIGPGNAYEFTFTAKPGMKLSLITMFGQSNDWFYAPQASGIDLFEKGKPVSGDLTARLTLWDAGTEVNQEPGVGPDQAPRQKAPNTGMAESDKVHKAKSSTFYSKTGELFRVTLTPQ